MPVLFSMNSLTLVLRLFHRKKKTKYAVKKVEKEEAEEEERKNEKEKYGNKR